MDEKVLFNNTINTVGKALDLRSRRHELIISNLANADTPGYKAFDLMVEKALADQNGSSSQLSMERTQPGHMKISGMRRDNLKPHITQVEDSDNMRGDGNTVDMDREMSNLASNQLQYRVSAQILAKKFQGLKYIIQGGNK